MGLFILIKVFLWYELTLNICLSISTDCDYVKLTSSGNATEAQDSRLGLYKIQRNTIGGKVVYKHSKRKEFLYYVNIKSGHWMVIQI